jgi:putative ATP-dependent endonuclease of the OLD family
MLLERLVLTNFRCFGPRAHSVDFDSGVTALVGVNGSGKTALLQALLRLFGVTTDQRRLRRQDFHVPASEKDPQTERTLALEVTLAFPELDEDGGDDFAVPEFFQQMATDEAGRPKCRLRLEATWSDDGSLEGAIDQRFMAIRCLGDYTDDDCIDIRQPDRARIQMIYVPATRDGTSQVTAFLRGRLWRAIAWSDDLRGTLAEAGEGLNAAFASEAAVGVIADAITRRWQQVHTAGTDARPVFRPVDLRLQEFIRKVDVGFTPDESGGERGLDELSEGQRSLFHLAMTAAALDVEAKIAESPSEAKGFQPGAFPLPALTLVAVEEPENSLSPYFLSRIVEQLKELASRGRAQALVSSHSASILARVDPMQVRHFRLDPLHRTAAVRPIRLPEGDEEASKFVREAVRIYPELYFSRFVVLGEGASEEVVIPRLAEAFDVPIDRSFVAIVPIGGRHVAHLWKLLKDLEIPNVTLLDLDLGRSGGGWGRIADICKALTANGTPSSAVFGEEVAPEDVASRLTAIASRPPSDILELPVWTERLQGLGVFFSEPLDLDFAMLRALPDAYRVLLEGMQGPSTSGDPRAAVLGEKGVGELYGPEQDDDLRWYRYLFLGRSKPSTHLRVLSAIAPQEIRDKSPKELRALVDAIVSEIDRPASARHS